MTNYCPNCHQQIHSPSRWSPRESYKPVLHPWVFSATVDRAFCECHTVLDRYSVNGVPQSISTGLTPKIEPGKHSVNVLNVDHLFSASRIIRVGWFNSPLLCEEEWDLFSKSIVGEDEPEYVIVPEYFGKQAEVLKKPVLLLRPFVLSDQPSGLLETERRLRNFFPVHTRFSCLWPTFSLPNNECILKGVSVDPVIRWHRFVRDHSKVIVS